ncbi:MAG: hypothetical protein ACOYYS_07425 [Chloroflexota bacterium]
MAFLRRFDVLIAIILLVSIFAMASQPALDPDMWWHLRAGDEIWHRGEILTRDVFSSTRAGMPWVNVFWLSDLLMYAVFSFGGSLALAVWVAVTITFTMAVVYFHIPGSPFLRAFLVVLASAVAAPTWTVRPQIVSFLLLAVLDAWLDAYKAGRFRRLWLLPVLFALWINLHGGVIWGWLLLTAVIVGEALNHFLALPQERRMSWKGWRSLVLWSLLTVPAVLLNPSGFAAWTLPFQQVSVSLELIHEWFSPNFHNLAFHPLLWMLFALLGALGFSGRSLDGGDFLKAAGFAYLAFYAQRNLGPFAIVAAPVLARYLSAAIDAWLARRVAGGSRVRRLNTSQPLENHLAGILNAFIIFLLAAAALLRLWAVASPDVSRTRLAEAYPQQAVAWIRSANPRGEIFNAYNWGGYLTWALREYPVFIDGRADLYGEEIIAEWFAVVNASPGWQNLLAGRGVNLILLEPWQPVVAQLPANGWQLLYEDDLAVIYGR